MPVAGRLTGPGRVGWKSSAGSSLFGGRVSFRNFMPDSLQSLLPFPLAMEQYLLILPAVIAGVVLLLAAFRKPLRHWKQERQIARAVKRMGVRMLDSVHLPDGLGGEVLIDKLLLAPDAILVVNVKRYEGLIFGGEQTDEWTQVINTRSYRFANPDAFLQLQVNAIRAVVPKVAVRGVHLFTHNARFPKGQPPSVLLLEELVRSARRPRMKDIPKPLREAWERIVAAIS